MCFYIRLKTDNFLFTFIHFISMANFYKLFYVSYYTIVEEARDSQGIEYKYYFLF